MNELFYDPVRVRELICSIACVAVLISSLEWLAPPSKLRPESLLAAEAFGSTRLERLWRPHGLRALFVLRAACALTFLACVTLGHDNALARASVLGAGMLSLPIRWRPPVGALAAVDGAEHMLTAVLLAIGPTFLLPSPWVLQVALAFIAAQVSLEYLAAGWAKATRFGGWARGPYLLQVFANRNYGHPSAAALLRHHPAAAGLMSGAVIVLEIALPLALVLPTPFAEGLLLAGLAFHAGTAVIMGLNTFVLAFSSTYPAILYCRHLLLG